MNVIRLFSESQKRDAFCKRLTAFLVLSSFILTNHVTLPVYAANVPEPAQAFEALPDKLSRIKISSGAGSVVDSFKGGSQTVILIQDAHAVAEAQENIQKLIQDFQKTYGINLVALEGASSRLDAGIFRSFPDQELLKKTLLEFHARGELTGTTLASLLPSESTDKAVYQGMENWELYEDGLAAYLRANENPEILTEAVRKAQKSLKAEKQKVYSPELLKIDRILEKFHAEDGDFIEALSGLSKFQKPRAGTRLAVLVEEISRDPAGDLSLYAEADNLARQVRKNLAADKTAEFNARYQEFQTSRLSPDAFALFLKEFTPDFSRLTVSPRLLYRIQNQRSLKGISGTKLFREFEDYLRELKDSFLKTAEEKKLDERSSELKLLEKISTFELSVEEWFDLRSHPRRENGLWESLKDHRFFYENAEARDLVFFENLRKFTKQYNTQTAVLIAGGFHTEGLKRLLKEKGFSYVVIAPNFSAIPDGSLYRAHMRGDVSWKKYFRIENGKINSAEAFARALRDKLIQGHKSQVTGHKTQDPAFSSENSLLITQDELRRASEREGRLTVPREEERDSRLLLKLWRDRIIQDLAAEGKTGEAYRYTPLIDEVLKGREGAWKKQWTRNIENFLSKLGALEQKNQLTVDNVSKILRPSAFTDWTYPVLSWQDSFNVRKLPESVLPQPRSKQKPKVFRDRKQSIKIKTEDRLAESRRPKAESQRDYRSELRVFQNIRNTMAMKNGTVSAISAGLGFFALAMGFSMEGIYIPLSWAAASAAFMSAGYFLLKTIERVQLYLKVRGALRDASYFDRGSFSYVFTHDDFKGRVLIVRRGEKVRQGISGIRVPQNSEKDERKLYERLKSLEKKTAKRMAAHTVHAGRIPLREVQALGAHEQLARDKRFGGLSDVYVQEKGHTLRSKYFRNRVRAAVGEEKMKTEIGRLMAEYSAALWGLGLIDLDLRDLNYMAEAEGGRASKTAKGEYTILLHDFGALFELPETQKGIEIFLRRIPKGSDISNGLFLLRNLTRENKQRASDWNYEREFTKILFPGLRLQPVAEILSAAERALAGAKLAGDQHAAYMRVINAPRNQELIADAIKTVAERIYQVRAQASRSELRIGDLRSEIPKVDSSKKIFSEKIFETDASYFRVTAYRDNSILVLHRGIKFLDPEEEEQVSYIISPGGDIARTVTTEDSFSGRIVFHSIGPYFFNRGETNPPAFRNLKNLYEKFSGELHEVANALWTAGERAYETDQGGLGNLLTDAARDFRDMAEINPPTRLKARTDKSGIRAAISVFIVGLAFTFALIAGSQRAAIENYFETPADVRVLTAPSARPETLSFEGKKDLMKYILRILTMDLRAVEKDRDLDQDYLWFLKNLREGDEVARSLVYSRLKAEGRISAAEQISSKELRILWKQFVDRSSAASEWDLLLNEFIRELDIVKSIMDGFRNNDRLWHFNGELRGGSLYEDLIKRAVEDQMKEEIHRVQPWILRDMLEQVSRPSAPKWIRETIEAEISRRENRERFVPKTGSRSELRASDAEQLKSYRRQLGLSQTELGKELNPEKPILQPAISQWETGVSPVPADILIKAEALTRSELRTRPAHQILQEYVWSPLMYEDKKAGEVRVYYGRNSEDGDFLAIERFNEFGDEAGEERIQMPKEEILQVLFSLRYMVYGTTDPPSLGQAGKGYALKRYSILDAASNNDIREGLLVNETAEDPDEIVREMFRSLSTKPDTFYRIDLRSAPMEGYTVKGYNALAITVEEINQKEFEELRPPFDLQTHLDKLFDFPLMLSVLEDYRIIQPYTAETAAGKKETYKILDQGALFEFLNQHFVAGLKELDSPYRLLSRPGDDLDADARLALLLENMKRLFTFAAVHPDVEQEIFVGGIIRLTKEIGRKIGKLEPNLKAHDFMNYVFGLQEGAESVTALQYWYEKMQVTHLDYLIRGIVKGRSELRVPSEEIDRAVSKYKAVMSRIVKEMERRDPDKMESPSRRHSVPVDLSADAAAAYFYLMKEVSAALDPDAVYVYPVPGADLIPSLAVSDEVFPVNFSTSSFYLGREFIKSINDGKLGERKAIHQKLLSLKPYEVLDADQLDSYPDWKMRDKPVVFIMKGFSGFTKNYSAVFNHLLNGGYLKPGDKILILDERDRQVFEKALLGFGYHAIGSAEFSLEGLDPYRKLEDIRLFFPNTFRLLEIPGEAVSHQLSAVSEEEKFLAESRELRAENNQAELQTDFALANVRDLKLASKVGTDGLIFTGKTPDQKDLFIKVAKPGEEALLKREIGLLTDVARSLAPEDAEMFPKIAGYGLLNAADARQIMDAAPTSLRLEELAGQPYLIEFQISGETLFDRGFRLEEELNKKLMFPWRHLRAWMPYEVSRKYQEDSATIEEAMLEDLIRVARALQRLHELGIAHGNLGSNQVHLRPDGRVSFSDFGHYQRGTADTPPKDIDSSGSPKGFDSDIAHFIYASAGYVYSLSPQSLVRGEVSKMRDELKSKYHVPLPVFIDSAPKVLEILEGIQTQLKASRSELRSERDGKVYKRLNALLVQPAAERFQKFQKIIGLMSRENVNGRGALAAGMIVFNFGVDFFVNVFVKTGIVGASLLTGNLFVIFLGVASTFFVGGLTRMMTYGVVKIIWPDKLHLNRIGLIVNFIPHGPGNLSPIPFVFGGISPMAIKEIYDISNIVERSVSNYTQADAGKIATVKEHSVEIAFAIQQAQKNLDSQFNYRRFKIRGTMEVPTRFYDFPQMLLSATNFLLKVFRLPPLEKTKGYSERHIVNLITREDLSDRVPFLTRFTAMFFWRVLGIHLPGYKKGTRPLLLFGSKARLEEISDYLGREGVRGDELLRTYEFDVDEFHDAWQAHVTDPSLPDPRAEDFIQLMFTQEELERREAEKKLSPVNVAPIFGRISSTPERNESWYYKFPSLRIPNWKWLRKILVFFLAPKGIQFAMALEIDNSRAIRIVEKIFMEASLVWKLRRDVKKFELTGWADTWFKVWAEDAMRNENAAQRIREFYIALYFKTPGVPGYEEIARRLQEEYPAGRIADYENHGQTPPTIERVKIPFKQNTIPGYLILPGTRKEGEKVPVVQIYHGFSNRKETSYFDSLERELIGRGIGVLRMDLLRHGENLTALVDPMAIATFIRAVTVYLQGREDVDKDRLGLFGFSFGGYMGLRALHHGKVGNDLKAVAVVNPPVFDTFKRFSHVLSLDREFLEYLFQENDLGLLETRLKELKLPTTRRRLALLRERAQRLLVFMGEKDRVVSPKDFEWLKEFLKELMIDQNGHKHVYSYPNDDHYIFFNKEHMVTKTAEHFERLLLQGAQTTPGAAQDEASRSELRSAEFVNAEKFPAWLRESLDAAETSFAQMRRLTAQFRGQMTPYGNESDLGAREDAVIARMMKRFREEGGSFRDFEEMAEIAQRSSRASQKQIMDFSTFIKKLYAEASKSKGLGRTSYGLASSRYGTAEKIRETQLEMSRIAKKMNSAGGAFSREINGLYAYLKLDLGNETSDFHEALKREVAEKFTAKFKGKALSRKEALKQFNLLAEKRIRADGLRSAQGEKLPLNLDLLNYILRDLQRLHYARAVFDIYDAAADLNRLREIAPRVEAVFSKSEPDDAEREWILEFDEILSRALLRESDDAAGLREEALKLLLRHREWAEKHRDLFHDLEGKLKRASIYDGIEGKSYYAFYKPRLTLSTRTDEHGDRTTVYDIFRRQTGLNPDNFLISGRLDYDVDGLVIFSDDGAMISLIMPSAHVEKHYRIVAPGLVTEKDLQKLRAGVDIPSSNGKEHSVHHTRPARAELEKSSPQESIVHLYLREGRYHQVKFMMETIGHPRIRLTRAGVGPLELEDLKMHSGEVRKLEGVSLEKVLQARRNALDILDRVGEEDPYTATNYYLGNHKIDSKAGRDFSFGRIVEIAKSDEKRQSVFDAMIASFGWRDPLLYEELNKIFLSFAQRYPNAPVMMAQSLIEGNAGMIDSEETVYNWGRRARVPQERMKVFVEIMEFLRNKYPPLSNKRSELRTGEKMALAKEQVAVLMKDLKTSQDSLSREIFLEEMYKVLHGILQGFELKPGYFLDWNRLDFSVMKNGRSVGNLAADLFFRKDGALYLETGAEIIPSERQQGLTGRFLALLGRILPEEIVLIQGIHNLPTLKKFLDELPEEDLSDSRKVSRKHLQTSLLSEYVENPRLNEAEKWRAAGIQFLREVYLSNPALIPAAEIIRETILGKSALRYGQVETHLAVTENRLELQSRRSELRSQEWGEPLNVNQSLPEGPAYQNRIEIIRGGIKRPHDTGDEMLDVLDASGNKMGISKKRTEVHRDGDWHETVHVYVVDAAGNLLLQKRAGHLKASPHKLQISVSGHVKAGKTVEDDVLIEAQEEFGVVLDPVRLRQDARIKKSYKSGRVLNREFSTVFFYQVTDEEKEKIGQSYDLNEMDQVWSLPVGLMRRLILEEPERFSNSLRHVLGEHPEIMERLEAFAARSELRSEAEARREFERFFGDKSPRVLKLVAGAEDLEVIAAYRSRLSKWQQLFEARGAQRINTHHELTLKDGTEIQFFAKEFPLSAATSRERIYERIIRPEFENNLTAFGLDLAPEIGFFVVQEDARDEKQVLVIKKAKGKPFESEGVFRAEEMKAMARSLGELHAAGIFHGDLVFQLNMQGRMVLRKDHMFMDADEAPIRVRFIDYGGSEFIASIASEKRHILEALRQEGVDGIAPESIAEEFERAYRVGMGRSELRQETRDKRHETEELTADSLMDDLALRVAVSLMPAEAENAVVTLRVNEDDIQTIIRQYRNNKRRLEEKLLAQTHLSEYDAISAVMNSLDENIGQVKRSFAIGAVLPKILEQGLGEEFLRGFLEGLDRKTVSEMLKNGAKLPEDFQAGLKNLQIPVREIDTHRPVVTQAQDQPAVPLAMIGSEGIRLNQMFLPFFIDRIEDLKNDPAALRWLGKLTSRALIHMADLMEAEALRNDPNRMKAELIKRLNLEGFEDLISPVTRNGQKGFGINAVLAQQAFSFMIQRSIESAA